MDLDWRNPPDGLHPRVGSAEATPRSWVRQPVHLVDGSAQYIASWNLGIPTTSQASEPIRAPSDG